MPSPKRSTQRSRTGLIAQAVCLGLVVGLGGFFVYNAMANLSARGIASGFGFLQRPAGFDIAFTMFPFGEGSTFFDVFLVGLSNTLLVSALCIIGSSLLGLLVALLRLGSNPLLRLLGAAYVEVIRNIPLLLQLFFWYFVVLRQLPAPRQSLNIGDAIFLNIRGLYLPFPKEYSAVIVLLFALGLGLAFSHYSRRAALKHRLLSGRTSWWQALPYAWPLVLPALPLLFWSESWGLSIPTLQGFNYVGGLQIIPELVALVLAISLYTAAFIAEIVRAGLLSVAKGQREAAQALGLSRWDTLRLVVLPQALRVILPPLTSQYLNVTKNSSLAAAIAFPDLVLVFAGTTLNVTGQALEIMGMTMAVYLVISLLISTFIHRYQSRLLRYEYQA